jgi:hypothetical protein
MLKIKGLDKLQNQLRDLSRSAKKLDGQHSIPLLELLNDGFISKHTKFQSAEQLFQASGYKFETQEDFANIPDKEWDEYIRANSSFDNWESMQSAAALDWTKAKLGL